MGLTTCQHCQHHPVYDQAEACPKCGGPIRSIPQTDGPTSGVSITRETHDAALESINRTYGNEPCFSLTPANSSPDYPETSIMVFDLSALYDLADVAGGWLEELIVYAQKDVSRSDVRLFRRMQLLKSIKASTVTLDDEALLEISKMSGLRNLDMVCNMGRATSHGWLQLAKLRSLEFLRVPDYCGDGRGMNYVETNEVRTKLRRQLPNTVIP